MSTVEFKLGDEQKKYTYIEEEIDTILVRADTESPEQGFELKSSIRSSAIGLLVNKADVVAHYQHWERTDDRFMGVRCTYKETPTGYHVIVDEKPKRCRAKFVVEPYYIERGDMFPPFLECKYHIDIARNDKRLQKDVKHVYHKDFEVNSYGVTPFMSEAERKQRIVSYMKEKMGSLSSSRVICGYFLLGGYGYKIPDERLATDVDVIFDEVIPAAFERQKEVFNSDGTSFLESLAAAIANGYDDYIVLEHVWIENGKPVKPDEKYLFYMFLRLCLKLMEVHRKNMYPYTLMDLRYISHYVERNCEVYLRKYPITKTPEKVYWNDRVVCENFYEFIEKSQKELEYFAQFGKK